MSIHEFSHFSPSIPLGRVSKRLHVLCCWLGLNNDTYLSNEFIFMIRHTITLVLKRAYCVLLSIDFQILPSSLLSGLHFLDSYPVVERRFSFLCLILFLLDVEIYGVNKLQEKKILLPVCVLLYVYKSKDKSFV